MTSDEIPFTQIMAQRLDDKDRRDRVMVRKAEAVIVSVLIAEVGTLPANVLSARRELEVEMRKEGLLG